MAVYIVAYDLRTPGKNYSNLIATLETFTHCKPQQSVWLIQAAAGETAIRDILLAHLDANDSLIVSEVSRSWAGKNVAQCGAWLNSLGY